MTAPVTPNSAPARADLSGTHPVPWEPERPPSRMCSCHGAVLRNEGPVDDDCPLHGLTAQALADLPPAGEPHRLCQAIDHRWVRCDDGVSFPATIYCAELAGHPPGQRNGGHGTRDGARW